MPNLSTPALWCRLAACREDLGDGKEWSIYLLNDLNCVVAATLERVSYEWGDRGHSEDPSSRSMVPPHGVALLWREGWEGAELNMELNVQVQAPSQRAQLSFEIGKLYRKRSPAKIEGVRTEGWLLLPIEVRHG